MNKLIVLVGPICAGKGQVGDILHHDFGYSTIRFSQALEKEVIKKYGELKRDYFKATANHLRETQGPEALAKITLQMALAMRKNIVIDGARNPSEITYLKSQTVAPFILGIDAPQELRFKRLLTRNRDIDPKTFEEFKKMDDYELHGDGSAHGMNINACLKLADHIIQNDNSYQKLKNEIRQLVSELK